MTAVASYQNLWLQKGASNAKMKPITQFAIEQFLVPVPKLQFGNAVEALAEPSDGKSE